MLGEYVKDLHFPMGAEFSAGFVNSFRFNFHGDYSSSMMEDTLKGNRHGFG